jgi:hypothetical protein
MMAVIDRGADRSTVLSQLTFHSRFRPCPRGRSPYVLGLDIVSTERQHMAAHEDLGPPIAYLALHNGTPVYDRDGKRIGVVEHVFAVGDIFEGLIIHTHPLPGRHLYADPEQIDEIRERGVVLAVARHDLHDPSLQTRRLEPGETSQLEARLRRAWDWVAGHLSGV